MERWQNKVAVVTGASSGIGAACCKDLLTAGMLVVGLARRVERMQNEFKNELPMEHRSRFYAMRCDVTKEDNIKQCFQWIEQKLGCVHVLINNAGVLRRTQLVAADNTSDLRAVIDTNIMGLTLCTREAFQSMKKHGVDGHVILINSITGHKILSNFGMDMNMYPASKFAVTAITELLRQEFLTNKTKIKVTSISPGAVDTEIFALNSIPTEFPLLQSKDISQAVIYCLQTPPHVQIHELTIKPIGEFF